MPCRVERRISGADVCRYLFRATSRLAFTVVCATAVFHLSPSGHNFKSARQPQSVTQIHMRGITTRGLVVFVCHHCHWRRFCHRVSDGTWVLVRRPFQTIIQVAGQDLQACITLASISLALLFVVIFAVIVLPWRCDPVRTRLIIACSIWGTFGSHSNAWIWALN